MAMSSDSPVADAFEGITKGSLEWGSDQIKSFIEKFKKKDLAFIRDEETINTVREEYNSGESKFYQNYIDDKELLLLVRMGLALRKLDKTNQEDKLHDLREKIYNKHKSRGLHVAEFVQVGILHRYTGILLEGMTSLDDFKKEITEVLKNIEKHVIFVQMHEKVGQIVQKATNILNAHSPEIFVVSGRGNAAKLADESAKKLEILFKNYATERMSAGEKEIIFFKKQLNP
jgi:hypothetical protein